MICKCFLPFYGFSLHFLDGVFWYKRVYNCDPVYLYFSFVTYVEHAFCTHWWPFEADITSILICTGNSWMPGRPSDLLEAILLVGGGATVWTKRLQLWSSAVLQGICRRFQVINAEFELGFEALSTSSNFSTFFSLYRSNHSMTLYSLFWLKCSKAANMWLLRHLPSVGIWLPMSSSNHLRCCHILTWTSLIFFTTESRVISAFESSNLGTEPMRRTHPYEPVSLETFTMLASVSARAQTEKRTQ